MSQRRYYVLSAQGEIGPHNRLEIRELLHAGDIAELDPLRTAAGTDAGCVIDLLSKPEESSSYRLATVDVVEPARATSAPAARHATRTRQATDPGEQASAGEPAEPKAVPVVTMALAATLVVLLVGWWWLSRGERHREAEQSSAVAAMPVVTIFGDDGSWVLGRDAIVTIRTAHPVEQALSVHLTVAGSAIPGVDFVPFPSVVEIPAGTDQARVACSPLPVTNSRQPAVMVAVAIDPHVGYQVGNQVGKAHQVELTLRSEESDLAQAGHDHVTWVSDLPFVDAWNFDHAPNRNQSHDGHPQVIDHVMYPKGLAIHPGDHAKDPDAHVTIALDGRFEEFLATVGIDDEMRDHREPSVTFQVWVDGQPQFDSGVMHAATPARPIRIKVTGAKTLRLVVTDGADGNTGDHADWGAARLISK